MASATYNLIRQPIAKKQQVTGMYNGYIRNMCPHVIGTKNGREQALFYQFAGGSSSGLAPAGAPDNWRCMPISMLSQVAVEDGEWHTAPNHSRPQTCVDEIDLEVEFSE